jgi:hypothetical protein
MKEPREMSEQELAKALAGLNESSPNRWRLQQELYRGEAVASIPPPKWHDGWLGKIAIGVIGFLLGAAASSAVLYWSGRLLGA